MISPFSKGLAIDDTIDKSSSVVGRDDTQKSYSCNPRLWFVLEKFTSKEGTFTYFRGSSLLKVVATIEGLLPQEKHAAISLFYIYL